jgi:hypothetical protein
MPLLPSLGVDPIFGGVTLFGLVTLEGSSPMLGVTLEGVLVILAGLRLVMLVGRTLVGLERVMVLLKVSLEVGVVVLLVVPLEVWGVLLEVAGVFGAVVPVETITVALKPKAGLLEKAASWPEVVPLEVAGWSGVTGGATVPGSVVVGIPAFGAAMLLGSRPNCTLNAATGACKGNAVPVFGVTLNGTTPLQVVPSTTPSAIEYVFSRNKSFAAVL